MEPLSSYMPLRSANRIPQKRTEKKQRRKISIQPLSLHDAANNQRLEMSHDVGHRTINMLRPTRNAQLVVSTA